jgi:hypothetical protein
LVWFGLYIERSQKNEETKQRIIQIGNQLRK